MAQWRLLLCTIGRDNFYADLAILQVLGGSFRAPGWMSEAILKDHVSSDAKCREHFAKLMPAGAFGSFESSEEAAQKIWTQFARHLGGCR